MVSLLNSQQDHPKGIREKRLTFHEERNPLPTLVKKKTAYRKVKSPYDAL
jgi:hypothetical protein